MEKIQHIWTEKYRPKFLNDIIGQDVIVKRLKGFVRSKSIPHCLFVGSAGIGKSTAALAICNELFGDNWRSNFLELNASDERGIDTIRVKVKDFARTVPIKGTFKIIFLDEADALTKDAQHALRRIMEHYSEICRFFLSCNYLSKIILPIQSRTAIFRFMPLSEENVIPYLKQIAEKEGLNIDQSALKAIFDVSEGDLRKALNLLQTAASEENITEKSIYSFANRDPENINKMLSYALSGNFNKLKQSLDDLMQRLSGEDIVKEMHRQIFKLEIPDRHKIDFLLAF